MIDEFQMRDLARELAGHYHQLQEMKQAHPPQSEARVMKPTPGPRTPGNWLMVSTYIDMEQRLREICFNAFGRDGIGITIHDNEANAPILCAKLAYHAQAIAELDWADDIAEELQRQARIINRRCNPTDNAQALLRSARTRRHLEAKYLPQLDKPPK
ncbi:hypothetical protein ACWWUU_05800 [Corynebacterium striatum]